MPQCLKSWQIDFTFLSMVLTQDFCVSTIFFSRKTHCFLCCHRCTSKIFSYSSYFLMHKTAINYCDLLHTVQSLDLASIVDIFPCWCPSCTVHSVVLGMYFTAVFYCCFFCFPVTTITYVDVFDCP